jgi:predicted small metal-binding protein
MKTMTCRQMGGNCDAAFQGKTSKEIMDAGAEHVKEMAASGDAEHIKILEMMNSMQNDPEAAKAWDDKFQADFAALPEDQS